HHHEQEPHREEQQRRNLTHPPVDDHEVEPPDGGHEGGEERVATVHGSSLTHSHHAAPANCSAHDDVALLHDRSRRTHLPPGGRLARLRGRGRVRTRVHPQRGVPAG